MAGSRIDLAGDPASPRAGDVVTLVVTVSGQNGADRYGVAGATVILALVGSPGTDALLDATSLTTDASGTATAKLTMSKTPGRHIISATSGTLTTQYTIDSLAGASQVSRAGHSGQLSSVPNPSGNPAILFIAAGIVLLIGFVGPSAVRGARSRLRPSPEAGRSAGRQVGLSASSKRTN